MKDDMVIPATVRRMDIGLPDMWYLDKEILTSHKEIFSSICGRLAKIIQQQKPIQDGELFDFGKIVIWAIQDSMFSFPSEFDGLSGLISDYWHFEASSDTNFKRKYSYIRLYQMVSLLQIFVREQKQNQKVLAALGENMQNTETISLLHTYPGITHRMLRKMVDLSPEALQIQLDLLKKGEFLTSRRSGDQQYYMLTNAGEALYTQLHIQKRKKRIICERRELLDSILQVLMHREMESYEIILLFEMLQNLGNPELKQLLLLLREYYYKWTAPARVKHDEAASPWILSPSAKNINLQKHYPTYFQSYQRKVIKNNLLSNQKYQLLQIYSNKSADTRMDASPAIISFIN